MQLVIPHPETAAWYVGKTDFRVQSFVPQPFKFADFHNEPGTALDYHGRWRFLGDVESGHSPEQYAALDLVHRFCLRLPGLVMHGNQEESWILGERNAASR